MVVIWGAIPMQCIAVLPCTCFAPRCSPAISWLPKSVSVLQSRCVSWHLGTAFWLNFASRQVDTLASAERLSPHSSCREAIIRWIQQEVSFNLLVFSDPGSRISRISRDESDLEKITGFLMIPKFRIACTHIYNYIYIFMIRLELKIIKAIENPVLSWFKFHFQCWFSWQPCVSQSAAQSQKCWASALLALTWRLNLAMQQLMMPTSPTRIGINKQNLKLTWD